MATIKELEDRIKRLEKRVSAQDKAIERLTKSNIWIVDWVLERDRAYCQQRREKAIPAEIRRRRRRFGRADE